jgi:LCP family protein required for cell wall assembly
MKRTWSRRAKVIGWVSFLVVGVLIATALAAFLAVRMQISGITHIQRIDDSHSPPKYTSALNLLLLGSDERNGRNRAIGGVGGCDCADTILVAHISPGRKHITVLSIPRDTVVPYYPCTPTAGLPGQQADPYAVERINATLAAGGPECVRETVEQQTGIHIDNVILLSFVGFQKVIDDIGGVNVCLPFAINNTSATTPTGGSGLNLSAGWHHISGHAALQFWRTRYNVANGSDIERIARDQYLMAQIVKGVLHSGVLHSPTKLYTTVGDVAKAMTTDASDTELFHIALSLRGMSSRNVQFITAPWTTYLPDPNEVQLEQPQADAVFYAIAHDSKLPPEPKRTHKGSKNGGSSAGGTGASGGQPMTVNPNTIKVTILDGSSRKNRTSQADTALTGRGFTVLGTGYAPATTYIGTVVEYSSAADLPAANTLKQQFTDVSITRVPGITAGTVEVILGRSFTALAPPLPTSASSINSLSGDYGGINASVRCRNSAFYGTFDQAPASKGNGNTCTC